MKNRTSTEIRTDELKKQMEKQTEAFLKEFKEMMEPLQVKHQRQIVPLINHTERGSFPIFGVDLYLPKNETLDTKPETK